MPNVWLGQLSMKRWFMTVENAVRAVAGSMVLLSLVLTILVNHWWLILAAFVGLNLLQSAFTHFCPAEMFFKKMGLRCTSCA